MRYCKLVVELIVPMTDDETKEQVVERLKKELCADEFNSFLKEQTGSDLDAVKVVSTVCMEI